MTYPGAADKALLILGSGVGSVFVNILLGLIILSALACFVIRIRVFFKSSELICLELIPNFDKVDAQLQAERLFKSLHGFLSPRATFSGLFRPAEKVSLEIKSENNGRVAYLVYVPKDLEDKYCRVVGSFLTNVDVIIREPSGSETLKVDSVPLRLSRRYVYPLAVDRYEAASDCLADLISILAVPGRHGGRVFQVTLRPAGTFVRLRARRYLKKRHSNKHIVDKLDAQLFHASVRVGANMDKEEDLEMLADQFSGCLAVLTSNGQRLRRGKGLIPAYERWKFLQKKSDPFSLNDILSPSELAALFHMPNVRTADIRRDRRTNLKLPPELRNRQLDLNLGENLAGGTNYEFGLTMEERNRHIFISGATGTGKSTLMLNMVMQDISGGKGVALIDPHGDLAESIIENIPAGRIKDVVYLDPSDIKHPIGLNLLETRSAPGSEQYMLELDFITEAAVSLMRKLFSNNEDGGSRNEYIFRNAVHTAMTIEGRTLFTVYRLLTDLKFRQQVIAGLEDRSLVNFWNNEFNQAGSMQRVKLSIGVTSKLGRLLRSTSVRRTYGQPHSTVDLDDILDSGKILVCNFSKGKLGEDNSSVLGVGIMLQLQLAAYRRQVKPEEDRRPFYIYVDEFQNFATPSFTQLLSEARKYKVFLTMAEQSLSQQAEPTLNVVMVNVATLISFRCSSPRETEILQPLFSPQLNSHHLLGLPDHQFFVRTLTSDGCYIFEGKAKLPAADFGSRQVVITNSRNNYSLKLK